MGKMMKSRATVALALGLLVAGSSYAVVTKHFSFQPREGVIGGGASVVVPVPKPVSDAYDRGREQQRQKKRELSIIGRVTKVVDAGTIEVTPNGGSKRTVYLAKVNAPKGSEACAATAKSELEKLLKDKKVTVKYTMKDQLGNVMGVVWLGKVNVNLSLVRSGFAKSADSEYDDAQRQAKLSKLGVWADAR